MKKENNGTRYRGGGIRPDRRDQKKREAKARQEKYDSLSNLEKRTRVLIRPGFSNKELKKLNG